MASYPSENPIPVPGGKPISGLTSDIEKYIIDNTEGDITAPQIHNMFKNIVNTIPLSGTTNFNISSLTQHDMLKYFGGKWINSENYTYHSSSTRTQVYSVNEVYNTGQTYNTGETYTRLQIKDITGLTYYYDTGTTYTQSEIDALNYLSALTDTLIISPQSGATVSGATSPYDMYATYDSIFWSGGTWMNKKSFIADDIVEMLELTKAALPTISGETVVDYIRSQFEKDVHVNKSGLTYYPDGDDDGDLWLHTDGIYGQDWQPSIYWYGQYGANPSVTTGLTHAQLTIDASNSGYTSFYINVSTGTTESGAEMYQVAQLDKDHYILNENWNTLLGNGNKII